MVKVGILVQKLPKQVHDIVLHTLGNELKNDETVERDGCRMSDSVMESGMEIRIGQRATLEQSP